MREEGPRKSREGIPLILNLEKRWSEKGRKDVPGRERPGCGQPRGPVRGGGPWLAGRELGGLISKPWVTECYQVDYSVDLNW